MQGFIVPMAMDIDIAIAWENINRLFDLSITANSLTDETFDLLQIIDVNVNIYECERIILTD